MMCKPNGQLDDTSNDHDATTDLNQKSAAVTNHDSMDQSNLVSPGSQNQKETKTSTSVDPPDHTSNSSWGTPFNPNPMPKDQLKPDHPPAAIDLTVQDSSSGHPCPPPPNKLFKYTFLDMSTMELIHACWEKEKPEHWCYEKYMHIHYLKSALPTPNLSTKKCGQFDEVFVQDTKPWKFKIDNDPNKFQDVLYTLQDACQLQSQPWAFGS